MLQVSSLLTVLHASERLASYDRQLPVCLWQLLLRTLRLCALQVYADGSVRVAHGGVEIGQGLGVKVLQTAAYALSQVSLQ